MSRRSGCARDLEHKGEKYIRISVKIEEGKIREVYIRGDFFCYPEDAIERLEKALVGRRPEEIPEVFREAMEGVELLGIQKEELLKLVLEASKCR